MNYDSWSLGAAAGFWLLIEFFIPMLGIFIPSRKQDVEFTPRQRSAFHRLWVSILSICAIASIL